MSVTEAPTNVAVLMDSSGVVNMTWTNPLITGGSAISNYIFSATPSAGIVFGPILDFDLPVITISGITPGTVYRFSVSIVNATGNSPLGTSSPFSYTIPPSAPRNPSAIVGSANVSLVWTAPSSNGGTPISGYIITYNPSNTQVNVPGNVLAHTVSGLTNGTLYTFSIVARNSAGTSPSVSVSATPVSVPGPPTRLTVVNGSSSGTATITWTDPVQTGGQPITGYTITVLPSSGVTFSSPVANPTTASGLVINTVYIFSLSVTNSVGSSPVVFSAPFLFTSVPDAPSGIQLFQGSGTNMFIVWNPSFVGGGLPITGYTITSTPATNTARIGANTFSSNFTGLTRGTSYVFNVSAQNANGSSPVTTSSSITPVTVPGTPTGVVVIMVDGAPKLTWSEPSSNGGSPITSYLLSSSPAGAIFTGNTLTEDIALTGLSIGVTYVFSVYTITSIGRSALPGVSPAYIHTRAPSAPTGVTATAAASSATVNWVSLMTDNGLPITTYTVTSTPASSSLSVRPPASSVTFTNLTNGTPYTFSVVATNTTGSSPAGVSNSVTPITIPNPPTGVNALPGNAQALVSWIPPLINGGSSITGYVITRNPSGTNTSVGNVTSSAVTGLVNGTPVSFTVSAVNVAGTSAASGQSPSVTPSSSLSVPGPPSLTIISASIGRFLPLIVIGIAAPSNSGGSVISNYAYSTDNGATYSNFNPVQTGSPFVITKISGDGVTSLVNGVTYTLRVKAINSLGLGEASNSQVTTPTAVVPGVPSIASTTPGNGSYTVAVQLPFYNGGSPITNYSYSTDGGTTFAVFSPAQTTSPLTITKLSTNGTSPLVGGTTYSTQIKAVNAVGSSGASSSVSVTVTGTPPAAPAAPTSLTATAVSGNISVAFTPGSTGGASLTNYSYSTDGGTTFRAFSPAQTTSPVTISTLSTNGSTSLSAGSSYSVKLRAINANGTSVDSAAASVTIPSAPVAPVAPVPPAMSVDPTPPTITSATWNSDDTVSIHFINGVGNVTNYLYTIDESTWNQVDPAQTSSPIVVSRQTNFLDYTLFSSLTNRARAYIRLIAVTPEKASQQSNMVTVLLKPDASIALSSSTKARTPGRPAYGAFYINVINKVGNSIISNYQYTTDNKVTTLVLSPPQNSDILVLKTLSNGSPITNGTYSVILNDINSAGISGDTSIDSSYIINSLHNPPDTPTLLSLVPDENGIFFTIKYTLGNSTNPIKTIGIDISDRNDSLIGTRINTGPFSLNKAILENGVYTSVVLINAFNLFQNRPFWYFNCNFRIFAQNSLGLNSSLSNAVYVPISSWKPKLSAVNYSSGGLTLILPTTPDNIYDSFNLDASGSIQLSIDGGNTFTTVSTDAMVNRGGPSYIYSESLNISYTFTPGTTYNLCFKWNVTGPTNYRFSSGSSNIISFTYGRPSLNLKCNFINSGFNFTLKPLCDGNLNDLHRITTNTDSDKVTLLTVGLPDPTIQKFFISINDSTFTEITSTVLPLYTHLLRNFGTLTEIDPIIHDNYAFDFTHPYTVSSGTYSIVLKYVYNSSGDFITTSPISVKLSGSPGTITAENPHANIVAVNNPYFGQPNIVNYLFSTDGGTTFKPFNPPQTSAKLYITYKSDLGEGFGRYGYYAAATGSGRGIATGNPLVNLPNTTYNIRIQPITTDGFISVSNSVAITTTTLTAIPTITNVICDANQVYIYVNYPVSSTSNSYFTLKVDGVTKTTINQNWYINTPALANGPYTMILSTPITNFTDGTPASITVERSTSVSTAYTFTPYLVPNAPVINSIAPTGDGAILTITPGATNGPPILNYLFSTDEFITTTVCNASPAGTTIMIPLLGGSTYNVSIQAVTSAGRSVSSNEVSVTV